MPESVTRVSYQAIADFTQLHLASEAAIADLDRIKAKEAELNAASAAQMDGAKAASAARVKAMQDETAAQNVETTAVKAKTEATKAEAVAEAAATETKKAATAAAKEAKKALDDEADSKKKNSSVTKDLASDVGSLGRAIGASITRLLSHKQILDDNTKSTSSFRTAWGAMMTDIQRGTDNTLVAAGNGFERLGNGLQKLLTSGNGAGGALPFLLLAPLIVGILALLNPLVAGISAAGGAVLGLASNLGTLAGLLVAAPSIISAYIVSISLLKEEFKGVGTALSAWQAVQDGTGTLQAYQAALDKLTPAQQTFVKWLESMSGAWKNFKNQITDGFFSQFQGDLSKVGPIFASITSFLTEASVALGQVVDGFIKLAATPAFASFLSAFSTENVDAIGSIGHAFMVVLDIIGKISVVALPFLRELDGSFASMMDNLDKIVTTAANDGSLVQWLGDVYSNLHLWWGIVSDIAKTILNYGTAAQDFGTWITQGLKDVTDGWLKASEAALKPGSSFKTWLEDIKPVVSELATIIGNLLHWWNETSSNPNNINKMLEMLKDINDHLGPALGNLLDTMAKTNIAPDLINLISNLVTLVSAIMSNGGAQAIESVIGLLTDIVKVLTPILSNPVVASGLVTIVSALGVLAGLSFVNKFVPILDLVASLLRLADAEGPITKVFNALTGYKAPATAAAADGAAGAAGGAAGAEGAAGGAAAGLGAATGVKGLVGRAGIAAGAYYGIKGVVDNAPDISSSLSDYNKLGWGSGLSDNKKIRDRANRDVGNIFADTVLPAGATGLLNDINPGMGKDFHRNVSNFATGAEGGYSDFVRGVGGAFANGAKQIGSTKFGNGTIGGELSNGGQQIGDFFTKTLPDADKNANKAISGIFDPKNWSNGAKQIGDFFTKDIPSFVKTSGKDLADFFKPVTDGFSKGAKQIGDFFTKTLPQGAQRGLKQVGDFFTKTLPDGFQRGAKQIGDFFTKTLPYDVGFTIGRIGRFFTKDLPDFAQSSVKAIGKSWNDGVKSWTNGLKQIGDFFTKTLPGMFKSGGDSSWKSLQDASKWLNDQNAKFYKWLSVDVPNAFGKAGSAIWKALQDAAKWLSDQNAKFVAWLGSLPGLFSKIGASIWSALQDAAKWLNDQNVKFAAWLGGLAGSIGKWAGDIWNGLPSIGGWISAQAGKLASFVSGIASSIAKAFTSGMSAGQGKHSGGTIYRSGGGSVPGSGDYDSVSAMLTPGEVVIRKSVVDSVGEQNLLALNDGLISYSQLLTRAMAADPLSKTKSAGMPSFMSGAGLVASASLSSLPANNSAVSFANSARGLSGGHSGFHVENLNVINPMPEKTSDSLPRTVRKLGYLSTARGR